MCEISLVDLYVSNSTGISLTERNGVCGDDSTFFIQIPCLVPRN